MLRLAILEKPNQNGKQYYRGTDRSQPFHLDNLKDTSVENQLFFWYLEEIYEKGGYIDDIYKANELLNIYNLHSGKEFELVEILVDKETPRTGTKSVGYDVSIGYGYSLVLDGLVDNNINISIENLEPVRVLSNVVKKHFSSKLNMFGLFDYKSDADSFLTCILFLQTYFPDLWESNELINKFKVVQIAI